MITHPKPHTPQWQQSHHLAVSATGKSITATQHALHNSGLRFYYHVLYTGAVITDHNYNILKSATLPNPLVQELVSKLSTQPGVAVFATTLETHDKRFTSSIPDSLSTGILQQFDTMCSDDILHHTFVGIPCGYKKKTTSNTYTPGSLTTTGRS